MAENKPEKSIAESSISLTRQSDVAFGITKWEEKKHNSIRQKHILQELKC